MRLPMTAAVMTLVGTMTGQLSSSLPSPQSSCASHTHDSNTQRLFCTRSENRSSCGPPCWQMGHCGPDYVLERPAVLQPRVPCSGSSPAGRRSSSSRRNRWGSGSGSCSGLNGGNRLRSWNRGTRPLDTRNSSARRGRWGSASTRRSAAVRCNSPSSPHRGPPRAGRTRPPAEPQTHVKPGPVHLQTAGHVDPPGR